jgi:hypothetical protein
MEPGPAPDPGRGTGRTRLRSLLADAVFPLLAAVAFVLLVGLDLNGSSIADLARHPLTDPSLVAGTPRPVRTDEFEIQTPNAVGNVRRGLPVQPWFGLVQVRQPVVTLGSPSRIWSEALRPQDWGYFAGAARGLAWHWWFSFLAGLVGLYVMLRVLLRSRWLAAGLAAVGTFSPYTAWWSAPSTALLLGYACGGTACALHAFRARGRAATVALGVGAGLLLTALAFTLYPPWQVSLGLVCVAVLVGQVVDLRVPLRRLGLVALAAGVAAAAPLALWYAQNRTAIAAIAATYYPGGRISTAGQAALAWLLDAPLNPWLAGPDGVSVAPPPGAVGVQTYANLSEVSSSWLPLPVVAAVVLLVAWVLARRLLPRRRGRGQEEATALTPTGDTHEWSPQDRGVTPVATFVAVVAALALLLGWALLPLPAVVGKVTLLDRVPPWRLPLALGLAVLVAVGTGALVLRAVRVPWWGYALLGLGAAGSVLATLWSSNQLPWHPAPGAGAWYAVSALVVGAGFALLAGLRSGRWQGAAALALAAYCLWSWALVNPLYRGLGPLQRDPVVNAMSRVEHAAPGTVATVYGDFRLVALVAASGVQTQSGVTFYPDPAIWQRLAPDQRALWNNYASFEWVVDPSQSPAQIDQVQGTKMRLLIDPCAPSTLALGMTWALSQKPIQAYCLQPVDVLHSEIGTVYRYRVTR